MKKKMFVLYVALLYTSVLFANAPKPVSYVDIKAFSGLWYEVARTYNRYEKECVAATVEYRLEENNTYKVHNRCFKNVIGGELIEYKGKAKPKASNGASMAKLDMTYYYIFTQGYRVIHLEEDYSAAVVTDKSMEQVWIMSRKPKLEQPKLNNILAKLEKNMDTKKLIFTPQDQKGKYK